MKLSVHIMLMSVIIAIHGAIFAPVVDAADPFPVETPGIHIEQNLPAGYEPSGAVWHVVLDRLFLVSNTGKITRMKRDGTSVRNWSYAADLEGICIADPQSNFVYLGIEKPDSIREFDLVSGQVVRSFDLTPWMDGPINSGLEALTFVPDQNHPEGGLFYAGLQADGTIYVFSLPIASSSTDTTVTFIKTITPVQGRNDLSGLHYDTSTGILYAIYDGANRLRTMQADGTFLNEWVLPGGAQEGITLAECDLIIADDFGPVLLYPSFPADDRDDDNDGVDNCTDLCADTAMGEPVSPDGCACGQLGGDDCQPNGVIDICEIADGLEEDCNDNGVPDSCDIRDELSPDVNGNQIPDECECELVDAPVAVGRGTCSPSNNCAVVGDLCLAGACYVPKNRYLSFETTNQNTFTAIRVRSNVLAVDYWVGTKDPESGVFRMRSTPLVRDWSTVGPIELADCPIVPGAVYEIQEVSELCIPFDSGYSPALDLPTASWGDLTFGRDGDSIEWIAPDIFAADANFFDIMGVIERFKSLSTAPPTSWCDLFPAAPDGIVDFRDVEQVTAAFSGDTYSLSTVCSK